VDGFKKVEANHLVHALDKRFEELKEEIDTKVNN